MTSPKDTDPSLEECCAACREARDVKCVCACGGKNHGITNRQGMSPLEQSLGLVKEAPFPWKQADQASNRVTAEVNVLMPFNSESYERFKFRCSRCLMVRFGVRVTQLFC